MALCGVALVGCGGDEGGNEPPAPTPKEDVFGWHMTSWEIGGEDTDFPKEVYLVLTKDAEQTQESVEVGTFTMYQDVVSNGFEKITGTYTFNQANQQLDGEYSDGEAWAYSYTVSGATQISSLESASEETMTLTETADPDYKMVYESLQIPATVIDNALSREQASTQSVRAGIRIL